MDNIFLETVAETYLLDKQIKNINVNQVFESLINFRNNIRVSDSDFNFIYEIIQDQNDVHKVEVLYDFLDLKYQQENLAEIFIDNPWKVVGLLTALLGMTYAAGGLDKSLVTLLGKYIQFITNLKKRIVKTNLYKMHKEVIDRYKIVEQLMDHNYSQCSVLCDSPKPENVNSKAIMKTLTSLFNSEGVQYSNNKQLSQDMCLLTCVLDYLSTSIAQLNLIYERCLSNTGEKDIGLNKTVTSIAPIGSECKSLREDLDTCIKDFNKIIDRVYYNNPRVKSTWIEILDKKIQDVKSNRKITSYGPINMGQQDIYHQFLNFNSDTQGKI